MNDTSISQSDELTPMYGRQMTGATFKSWLRSCINRHGCVSRARRRKKVWDSRAPWGFGAWLLSSALRNGIWEDHFYTLPLACGQQYGPLRRDNMYATHDRSTLIVAQPTEERRGPTAGPILDAIGVDGGQVVYCEGSQAGNAHPDLQTEEMNRMMIGFFWRLFVG